MQKIKFRRFEQSRKTMKYFKETGLEKDIDSFVEVESNYSV